MPYQLYILRYFMSNRMASWTEIPEDAKEAIISEVKESLGGRSLSELTQRRDEKLVKLFLKVI